VGRSHRLAAVVLAVGLVGACGGEDASTLERADAALSELRSGNLALDFTARAGEGADQTEPVGFRIEGAFDLDAGETYPVLDLTYTRDLGGDQQALTVRSDGDRVVVFSDGHATEATADQAAPLQKADGGGGLTEGLGIAGWIVDPEEDPGPRRDGATTTRVRGTADAADLLADVTTIAIQLTGESEVTPLDDDAADRLQRLVRSSAVEVLVGADDVPRSLTASLVFGASVPDELRAALGRFAGARLDIAMTISEPGANVPSPDLERGPEP
jgi:hypothetical protein